MIIEESYKGYKIELDDKTGEFKAVEKGEAMAESTTLKGLKLKIDQFSKQKINKQPAMKQGWGSEIEDVVITSVIEEKGRYSGSKEFYAWVYQGNSRSKERLETLIKPTEKNKQLVKTIKELKTKKDSLDKQIDKLKDSFEMFSPEDFGLK